MVPITRGHPDVCFAFFPLLLTIRPGPLAPNFFELKSDPG